MTDATLQDRLAKLSPAQREALLARARAGKPGRARPKLDDPPIPHVDRGGVVPLSHAQQRLWFLEQLAPGSGTYNVPAVLRVRGRLDLAALERAFAVLIARHESLRTCFVTHEGEARQVIDAAPARRWRLEHERVPSLARGLELAALEIVRPFDLARGPLLRARVLQADDEDQLLCVVLHHIVSDDWSTQTLMRELGQAYSAATAGREPDFAPLSHHYADFAAWQRARLDGPVGVRALEHWRQRLAGLEALSLATDHPRPAIQRNLGATHGFELDATLGAQLDALAHELRITPFSVMLAAFFTFLHRWSGVEDFAVGVPVANRSRPELEGIVGMFVNTVVARCDCREDPRFAEFAAAVHRDFLDDQRHAELPFEHLVSELGVERDLSRAPLVQVLFAWAEQSTSPARLGELELELVTPALPRSKFDLTLQLVHAQAGEPLRAGFEYDRALFDAATIASMATSLATMLEAIVAAPEQRLSDLALVGPKDESRLLQANRPASWSAPAERAPTRSLIELVRRSVRANPDASAIEFGEASVSYAELLAEAEGLTARLTELGVERGDTVAVFVERSLAMPVAVLAVILLGAACLPLEPNYPDRRLQAMLEIAEVSAVITSGNLRERLAWTGPTLDFDALASSPAPTKVTLPDIEPDELAYVVFTSGSTGQPKGIGLTHRMLVELVEWHLRIMPGRLRTLQLAALSFDASFHEMFVAWTSGASLILVAEDTRRDVPTLARLIAEARVERVIFPVVILQRLAEELLERPPLADLALRHVMATGEALRVTAALRGWARQLPETRFHNHYGPSETHVVTAWTLPPDPSDWGERPSIGWPLPSAELRLLDSRGRLVPRGATGELYVGGACLARGYLGQPGLTAARFVPDAHAHGARVYRTGDLARYRADGSLDFLGRIDDQLKIRGFRVEPAELEGVLVTHAHIDTAVAMASDVRGQRRLVAWIVGPDAPDDGELLRFLRERVPDYMLPAAIVRLAALPLNANGKVDRGRLPTPEVQAPQRAVVGPRTELERTLVTLWAELLALEPTQISVDNDFFALGGHSLLATRLLALIRKQLGVELPVRELFLAPTIAGLAARLEPELALSKAGPAIEARNDDRGPLSFAQRRMWFLDRMDPDNTAYTITAALRLRGALDIEALRASFEALVARHEVLRTRIVVDSSGGPIQEVLPAGRWTLEPEPASATMLATIAAAESRHRFDLERGLLLRTRLLELGPDDHALFVGMHHIVSDGWSVEILIDELERGYAHVQGADVEREPLPVQYLDYARWQRDWLRGEIETAQLGYWTKQLHGLAPLELPSDHRRPAVRGYAGASLDFTAPAGLGDAVDALARRSGATRFMVLLAGFDLVLARWAGADEVCVGTPNINRSRAELHGLIGLFVNSLALRTSLTGDPTGAELIARVRQTCLDAQAHQDVPLERVIDALELARDTSRTPLFQHVLVVQNATRRARLELAGVEAEPLTIVSRTAKFDLTLIAQTEAGLRGRLEFSTELFDERTAQRLLRHWFAALEQLTADPARAISTIDLRDANERVQLRALNPAPRALAAGGIATRFAACVARDPGAIALDCDGRQMSYAELAELAYRLAHALRARGVGPETLVGVVSKRSPGRLVALLGVLIAGGAYLPLDLQYPPQRLMFMLDDSGVRHIVSEAGLHHQLPKHGAEVLDLDELADELADQPTRAPELEHDPRQLAYVLYTSGSTGRPKGVAVDQAAVLRLVCACSFAELDGRRVLHAAPLAFDASTFELWGPLLNGGCCVIQTEALPTAAGLRERTATAGVEVLWLTSSLFNAIVDQDPRALAGARQLLIGGEALSVEHVRRFLRACPQTELINGYGPTEGTTFTCCYSIPRDLPASATSVPIGRPIANTRVHVLDARMRPVAIGVPGELYIGGLGLARGYWRRPTLSAERFVPDPFEPGQRLYRSGDRVRVRDDGNLEFLGRLDSQVKVRGFRIELGEIEAALAASPEVLRAAATVRLESSGHKRLHAYVVPRPERALDLDALRERLAASLPAYMVPSSLTALDALPLNANGKIDRVALPEPARATTQPTNARSEAERRLAAIWAEVLGLDEVGIHDNFFALGGDSILSLLIVHRAREAGLAIRPQQLFTAQTVAALAALAQPINARAIQHEVRAGPVPLTAIQRWFVDLELAAPDHFNQGQVLRLRPGVTAAMLRHAFAALIDHHDALRTRLRRDPSGAWSQRIEGPGEVVSLRELDLSLRAKAEREAALGAVLAELHASLSLERGPLLAAARVELGECESRLAVVVHHLVIDGVSWRIVLGDLERGLAQLAAGECIDLGPKTTGFRRWAEACVALASSPTLAPDRRYWAELCDALAADPPAPLPRDADGPERARGYVEISLDGDRSAALIRGASRAVDAEPVDLMLTALAVSLGEWLGRRECWLTLESHGRELADAMPGLDLSRSVGWFTAAWPQRLELPADELDWTQRVARVRAQRLAVPRVGLGYGLLRYLAPDDEADLARLPAPELAFNYLGIFDGALARDGALAPAPESSGPGSAAANARAHLIEINAAVSEGVLGLEFGYAEPIHSRETVTKLARRYLEQLEALVDHCAERAQLGAGLRPQAEQLQLAGLDQAELDRLAPQLGEFQDLYPLSPMQAGMLFHHLYAQGSTTYWVQATYRLRGVLDREAFARAWELVIDRHPALRSTLVWRELAQPLQRVAVRIDADIEELDWSDLPETEVAAALTRMLEADRAAPPALDRGPLLRLSLMRRADDLHLFALRFHHVLLDGWSLSRVFGEVTVAYEELSRGLAPRLGPVVPFRVYIEWLLARDPEADEGFWREYLAGFEAPTPLPWSLTLASGRSGSERVDLSRRLTPEATAALTQFARDHRVTLGVVIQAAWALLLAHLAERGEVVYGLTMSGRPAELGGAEAIVGCFVNSLPIRARIDAELDLATWLAQLQTEQQRVAAHQFTPLTDLRTWSEVHDRYETVFDSLVVIENAHVDEHARRGAAALEVESVESFDQTELPLTLLAYFDDALLLRLSYDPESFADAPMQGVLGQVCRLLERMVATPAAPLSSFARAHGSEREQVSDWARRPGPAPEPASIHARVARAASRTPDAPALIGCAPTGEVVVSFAELVAGARRLARELRARGVEPGARVGVCLRRSPRRVIAQLAVLEAGAAYLPLDPDYPRERLRMIIGDAEPAAILTERGTAAEVSEVAAGVTRICVDGDHQAISGRNAGPVELPVPASAPAYLIYTSGSTGTPKGVVNSHAGACNLLAYLARRFEFSVDDRVLHTTPFSFDVSVAEIFATLQAGAALVIPEPGAQKDPQRLRELISTHEVRALYIVPSLLRALTSSGELARCPSVSRILAAGEALSRELVREVARQSEAELHDLYGPTEAAIYSTHARCSADDLGPVAIGVPVDNAEAWVLDAALEPVAIGVPGDLYLGGAGLAAGYHRRPALTAERFIPDPRAEAPGSRLYATGDRARWRWDGQLDYLGRHDHQVKLRGFRIECGEIEAALDALAEIRESVVVVRRARARDDDQLVAYLVLASAARLEHGRLRARLAERLPDYMIPSRWVTLERMPLSANGKLDRAALPDPDDDPPEDDDIVAPRDQLELRVASAWKSILGLSSISVEANFFFDLGGHSLLAMQVMTRLQREFGPAVMLRMLFANPTIEKLAVALRAKLAASTRPSPMVPLKVPAPGEARRAPLVCVHPAPGNVLCYTGLARYLERGRPLYAFEAPGLDGGEPYYEDVPSMAARYVDELRRIIPDGPYFLAGHSFGALVAYEMGQVLRARGAEVALVTILDAMPPRPGHSPTLEFDVFRLLAELLDMFNRFHGTGMEASRESLTALGRDAALAHVLEQFKRAQLLPPSATVANIEAMVAVEFANVCSYWSYEPKPYDGALAVIRCRAVDFDDPRLARPDLSWADYVSGPIDVHHCDGDHISMLTDANVASVAAALERALARAEARLLDDEEKR